MFGHRYFGARYYGPRYWGPAPGDGVEPPAPEVQQSGGVWDYYHSPRRPTDDEIREERERLGILPREQRKLDRAAKAIARRIPQAASEAEIAAEIERAKEFDKIMADLTARNRQALESFALLIRQAIEWRILEELRDENDAIAMLLLEM